MIGRWWWGPKRGGEIWPKDRSAPSFDGTVIRYTLLGPARGPVVAFCAGFLCPDTYWRYLVPGITPDHRVLVWNYRGVGVSDLPARPRFHALGIKPDDLSIEANARDLAVLLDAEDIRRATLVGHSMGAQTMLEFYRLHPDRVNGMVSVAGAYGSPLRTFYGTDLSARIVPFALPLLHALPRVTLIGWRALMGSPFSFPAGRLVRAIGPGAKREDMDGYFEHLSMIDPLIAAKMVRGMHAHRADDLLAEIDVPFLVAHGTADPFTPPAVARHMAETIPEAELLMLHGGSHTLPIERPREILDALRPFLERIAADDATRSGRTGRTGTAALDR